MQNKFKKATLLIVALLLVSSLFLAACGKETATPTPTPGSGLPLIGSGAVKYDPNVKLTGKLVFWGYEEGKAFEDLLVQKYKELQPGVEIEAVYFPWGDYWTKLPIAIANGTGPDLYYMHNMNHVLMVDGGLMDPYPSQLVDNLKEDYLFVGDHEYDGKLYYMDTGIGHGMIFYNKTHWAEAGLTDSDIPTTWEDLAVVAKKLTKKDASGKIVQAGFNGLMASNFLGVEAKLMTGQFVFSADGKSVNFNNADYIKTFNFFNDLNKEVISPTFPDYYTSFIGGTSSMTWQHPWFAGSLKGQASPIDFGMFPQPKFANGVRNTHYNNGDSSYGLNPKSSDESKKIAIDALTLFLASDDMLKAWDKFQGLAPSKKSLATDTELLADPVIGTLMKDIDNSLFIGPFSYDVFNKPLDTAIEEVVKNGKKFEDLAAQLDKDISANLADSTFQPSERNWKYADELK